MIITDTTPERNMANIFNAIDTLKQYISLWGDNKVGRELERVLHIFEMDAFMAGKEIELSYEDVQLCLDFWPVCFDGMEVKIS